MADEDAPQDGAPGRLRAFLEAWTLVLVEVTGLAAICAGVALIFPPASFVVGGVLLILAVERGSSG